MQLPDFFDAAPRIRVRDPLAEFLGAAPGGVLEYGYADVVKLAGHSCPTVASAYLMARAAFRALYPDSLPVRGGISVELREDALEGVTGVIANVLTLLTGATVDSGFKGLAGRFARHGLLHFGVPMRGEIRFTRLDNGQSVELSHRPQTVARPATMSELLRDGLAPQAPAAARRAFAEAWQGWVRAIVIEHADDPALIELAA